MPDFCIDCLRYLSAAALACILFDGWFDKWADQVDLLEYQYGDKYEMVQRAVKQGVSGLDYVGNVNGPCLSPIFFTLCRELKRQAILEEKVNLRQRLASNMQNHLGEVCSHFRLQLSFHLRLE